MQRSADSDRSGDVATLDELTARCAFPVAGTPVDCAFSGGPDSTALLILARHAALVVTAHHVDHGIRPESADEADRARSIAHQLGVAFRSHSVGVATGPNLEARAREARRAVLPPGALTGHTADDQAETVLLRLIRGSGSTGLSGIEPGPTHPLLRLRRWETSAVCENARIDAVHDASNERLDVWRNRVRGEVMPLLADIAGRDVTPILTRTAGLLRDESELLDELAAPIDPADARALGEVSPVLARRALRRWLTEGGYPPDAAAIDRVMAVVRGEAVACELPGGRRVQRTDQRLRLIGP
ncbi:tRNA lysidine(34) synthetase TilS [Ilumatobacter sp.]|uniref:tRNA lysidine(34) synthetase TilS n=1 Tax=Ilumatobacter sp. TaxID=1967498 RepID=UPI003AF7D0DE